MGLPQTFPIQNINSGFLSLYFLNTLFQLHLSVLYAKALCLDIFCACWKYPNARTSSLFQPSICQSLYSFPAFLTSAQLQVFEGCLLTTSLPWCLLHQRFFIFQKDVIAPVWHFYIVPVSPAETLPMYFLFSEASSFLCCSHLKNKQSSDATMVSDGLARTQYQVVTTAEGHSTLV